MNTRRILMVTVTAAWAGGCAGPASHKTPAERLAGRDYPSVFQAWNPIHRSDVSLKTSRDRLKAAARHDLLWEEPVSQLGYGVNLVLGAVWDHEQGGLATRFTRASQSQALANRQTMLRRNPHMVFLMEIRWKDAPGSYLPEDSPWWMRDQTGLRKVGWTGGPEPYYYLDYKNPGFRGRICEQAQAVMASGVYDGIMLDWWGSHGEIDDDCIDMLKGLREAVDPNGLIVVNNDRLSPLPRSAPYVNGAFMEETAAFHDTADKWRVIRDQLIWFETHLAKPVVNCLEIQAGTEADMRAGLAMTLVYSDGCYLFAQKDNQDPAPDHLHDWFAIYDARLGRPTGPPVERPDGAVERAFDNGQVVYNPPGAQAVLVTFTSRHVRVSNGKIGTQFYVSAGDGEVFLKRTRKGRWEVSLGVGALMGR